MEVRVFLARIAQLPIQLDFSSEQRYILAPAAKAFLHCGSKVLDWSVLKLSRSRKPTTFSHLIDCEAQT
jgi:hypothetical protein